MSSVIPSFAIRSSSGIVVNNGPPNYEKNALFKQDTSKSCRIMVFSPDGKYFAWTNGISIKVVLTESWAVVGELPLPKASSLTFSPKGTYLLTWEAFIVSNTNPEGTPNLHVYKTENFQEIKSFIHKKQGNWELQWSSDETVCARMVNNDVVFYEAANFERIVHRINMAKIVSFSLACGPQPCHVLCFSPGVKGQPALGRLFKYPNFEAQQAIASKSFFQAEKVDYYWNNKGTSALLMTSTEVDKTGASYYGKQVLHYMATNGDTALVSLSKEGSIYSVSWSPKDNEFCVVYGFMPSKATIYNLKCEAVFELGTAPRNVVHYNPQGNILLLAGFGNLRGQVELWDVQGRKKIGSCDASDTTLLRWSPDGMYFLTATTAPRLRIGNGYKIWHYSGALVFERPWNEQEELYDIKWQEFPSDVFKEPVIKNERIEGITASQPQASKEVYRPPAARGKPPTTTYEDDKKNVSKAALRQKKKREAKRAKKLEEGEEVESVEKEKFTSDITIVLTGDAEKDKKIKNIKKKLDAITKLKLQKAEGKVLEINQESKLKNEEDLLKELKSLQL